MDDIKKLNSLRLDSNALLELLLIELRYEVHCMMKVVKSPQRKIE